MLLRITKVRRYNSPIGEYALAYFNDLIVSRRIETYHRVLYRAR